MNLLIDRYDQVLGLAIWGPWVAVVILGIWLLNSLHAIRKVGRAGYLFFKFCRDKGQREDETAAQFVERLLAEARELKAALDECGKKADRAQELFNDNVKLTGQVERLKAARYPKPLLSAHPVLGNPAKNGEKGKKKAPKKILKKPVAKPKKRA